uniref:Uncharacterized protein LOC108950284 n=1 Tax=Phallusia mammillata TaxID=59560 RepID=A0A6F9DJZ7_9ASCI|nr:uncharacterized protein LOC108950284 [Phallusia mammillata]
MITNKMFTNKIYFECTDQLFGIQRKTTQCSYTGVITTFQHMHGKKLKSLCHLNGKEKDVETSVPVIVELGDIQQHLGNVLNQFQHINELKNLNKIAYIRSAVLLNAALARKPNNSKEIQNKLYDLCSCTLNEAGAQNSEANLVDKAMLCRASLTGLRQRVEDFLEQNLNAHGNVAQKLQFTKSMEDLQQGISEQYITLMKEILDYCVAVMGTPPCKYALLGMGSLAKQEITPYSDFESIIILEDEIHLQSNYEEILDYFRWVAMLFQVVLVNMGETIIRFMAIPGLNSQENKDGNWFYDAHTPCGISPDGFAADACKNPLGRQEVTQSKPHKLELIKTSKDMVELVDQKVYGESYDSRLADMLTKTCLVTGDKNLYNFFQHGVKAVVNQEEKNKAQKKVQESVEHMQANLTEFNSVYSLLRHEQSSKLDIKRFVYRSLTLLISALGRHYNIEEKSSFAIVRKLVEQNIFPRQYMDELLLGIAIICKIRLLTYSPAKEQKDLLSTIDESEGVAWSLENSDRKRVDTKMREMVHEEEIDCFFNAAIRLQSFMAQKFKLVLAKPSIMNHIFPLLHTLPQEKLQCLTNFYLGRHEKVIQLCEEFQSKQETEHTQDSEYVECMQANFNSLLAGSYLCLKEFEKSIFHMELALASKHMQHNNEDKIVAIGTVSLCYVQLNEPAKALQYAKQGLTILESQVLKECEENFVATMELMIYHLLFVCHYYLENFEETDKFLKLAKQKLSEISGKSNFNKALEVIAGQVLGQTGDLEGARVAFLKALDQSKKQTDDETTDPDVGNVYFAAGVTAKLLGMHTAASENLETAHSILKSTKNPRFNKQTAYLEITQAVFQLVQYDDKIADNFTNVKVLLELFDKIDIAMEVFTRPSDYEYDATWPSSVDDLAKQMDKFPNVLQNLGLAPGVVANNKQGIMKNLPETLYHSGKTRNKHIAAMADFKLAITMCDFINIGPKVKVRADCLKGIADSLCVFKQHDTALENYKQELKLRESQSAEEKSPDSEIATCYHCIGSCHRQLGNDSDAFKCFRTATDIRKKHSERLPLYHEANRNMAMGKGLFDEKRFEKAKHYFEKELEVRQNMRLKAKNHEDEVKCQFMIALCHYNLGNSEITLNILNKVNAVLIDKRDTGSSQTKAECMEWIGKIHQEMNLIDKALENFQTELQIRFKITSDMHKDAKIAACYFNMGMCYLQCFYHEEAATKFKLAQEVLVANGSPEWKNKIDECQTWLDICQQNVFL